MNSLRIGDYTYGKYALLALLSTPTRGDASLILLRHIVAAKLNLAAGSGSSSYEQTAEIADALFRWKDGYVPLEVRTWTPLGQWFLIAAVRLDVHHHGC